MKNSYLSKILYYLKLLTLADKLLITCIATVSIFILLGLNWLAEPGAYVNIDEAGNNHYRFNLNKDNRIICHGPVGETVIQIKDGKARVLRSDCPNQICVKSGVIDKAGQIVVCIPNKVILKIEGDRRMDPFDVVTE